MHIRDEDDDRTIADSICLSSSQQLCFDLLSVTIVSRSSLEQCFWHPLRVRDGCPSMLFSPAIWSLRAMQSRSLLSSLTQEYPILLSIFHAKRTNPCTSPNLNLDFTPKSDPSFCYFVSVHFLTLDTVLHL